MDHQTGVKTDTVQKSLYLSKEQLESKEQLQVQLPSSSQPLTLASVAIPHRAL